MHISCLALQIPVSYSRMPSYLFVLTRSPKCLQENGLSGWKCTPQKSRPRNLHLQTHSTPSCLPPILFPFLPPSFPSSLPPSLSSSLLFLWNQEYGTKLIIAPVCGILSLSVRISPLLWWYLTLLLFLLRPPSTIPFHPIP